MMNRVMKLEIKRAFNYKNFIIPLSIGIIISFIQFLLEVYPLSIQLDEYVKYSKGMIYPGWLYSNWIGGNPASFFSYLYFLILPILAVMPFGNSFFCDIKNGFIQNVCIRTDKKKYVNSKYISTFISSGIVVIIPLIFNFYLASMFLPSLKPEMANYDSLISATSTFPFLFYEHPFIYVCLFIVIIFVISGLLGVLALTCSYYINYKFIVTLSPFLLNLFFMTIFDLLNMEQWELVNFLNPSYHLYTLYSILSTIIILTIISVIFFLFKSYRIDIY